jgi:peptidoglycan/LPS O-acetylase OafA/YrhL
VTRAERLLGIDALRGLAALVVVLHHVLVFFGAGLRAELGVGVMRALNAIGDRHGEAVLLFFLLSGFSIRLSLRARGLGSAADLNHYLYRRFRRILPPYWLALAASALAALIVPVQDGSAGALPLLGNLLFLQSSAAVPGCWVAPFARNGPLWSLSFEMFYYLAFPLFWRLVQGRQRRLLVALALSVVGVGCNRLWPNPFAQFVSHFLVWYLGVELAERRLVASGGPPAWIYAPLAGLLLGAHLTLGSQTLRSLAVGAALMQLGCLWQRFAPSGWSAGAVGRGLVKLLAGVGGFSYALYLLHYPVLRVVAARLDGPVLLGVLCTVLGCLGLAFGAERALTRSRYAWLERRYLRGA